jgi:hypothetical protein
MVIFGRRGPRQHLLCRHFCLHRCRQAAIFLSGIINIPQKKSNSNAQRLIQHKIRYVKAREILARHLLDGREPEVRMSQAGSCLWPGVVE